MCPLPPSQVSHPPQGQPPPPRAAQLPLPEAPPSRAKIEMVTRASTQELGADEFW
jgi:hypothetical protein